MLISLMMTILALLTVGCGLVLTMAVLSHREAERQIKKLSRERVRVGPERARYRRR